MILIESARKNTHGKGQCLISRNVMRTLVIIFLYIHTYILNTVAHLSMRPTFGVTSNFRCIISIVSLSDALCSSITNITHICANPSFTTQICRNAKGNHTAFKTFISTFSRARLVINEQLYSAHTYIHISDNNYSLFDIDYVQQIAHGYSIRLDYIILQSECYTYF